MSLQSYLIGLVEGRQELPTFDAILDREIP